MDPPEKLSVLRLLISFGGSLPPNKTEEQEEREPSWMP